MIFFFALKVFLEIDRAVPITIARPKAHRIWPQLSRAAITSAWLQRIARTISPSGKQALWYPKGTTPLYLRGAPLF